MAVVPFRWQGKARLQQLRALLAARAGESLRGWTNAQAQVDIDPAGWADRPVCDDWHALRTPAGTLFVGVRRGTWEQWGSQLAVADACDGIGMADGIGRRAAADILRAAIGAAADCEFADIEAPETRSLEARFGAAEFQCRAPGLYARLVLDAGLCDALAPRPRPDAEALAPRAEAVLPTDVVLEAFLDLGRASLEQTVGLRPGDVIKTGIALDSVLQLKSASGAVVASGALVSSEGRRALRCSNAIQE